MKFAVIGTREPDAERLRLLEEYLHGKDPATDTLVTGAAIGVDQTAADRWLERRGQVHCYLPWPAYEAVWTTETLFHFMDRVSFTNGPTDGHIATAMKLHPNPGACTPSAKKLHGRNVQIIESVEEVFALPGMKPWGGGTAMGMRITVAIKKRLVCPVRHDLVESINQELQEKES